MKRRLFQLGLLTVFSGALASAAIIVSSPCSVLQGANQGSSSASSICSVTADPGFFLNSITITVTSDYTGFQSGTPTATLVYSYAQNTPGFGAIPNGVVTTSGTNSVPVQNSNQTVNGNFGGSATVQFAITNSVAGGSVTGVSGVMTISATETASAVPEPATMMLFGSGLIGLAVFNRRRWDKRQN
jgi:hypothetical protein